MPEAGGGAMKREAGLAPRNLGGKHLGQPEAVDQAATPAAKAPYTMTRLARHLLMIVAVYTLAWFILGFTAGRVRAHDIYMDWKMPDSPGLSCCNNNDCRPTRAYMDDDGRWRAWDGRAWLVVPSYKMLPTDLAGDGRSHLCASPSGTVLCFSPGEVRG